MLPPSQISELLRRAAAAAGFELAGIAPVGDFPELEYFPQWIAEGRGGEMQYLATRDERGQLKRASLKFSAPWARSVIVCAMNYNTAQPYSTETSSSQDGWISRYAWTSGDYHDTVINALRQVECQLQAAFTEPIQTRCYVDTGPLVERIYAKYAGIGWIGKNTCIINQRLGSWSFLGVILTSLELPPDLPAPDRCGTCTRCIEACPTDAFIGPYKLDASRCISYLTIEKHGPIPEELRAGVGRHVFGCDICQDVCPWNRNAPVTGSAAFQPRPGLVNPALEWLAGMDDEQFRQTFRSSPVKRTKRSGLRRNAVVAMGNSGDQSFIPLLEEFAKDPDKTVSEHARWALGRLRNPENPVVNPRQSFPFQE